jgi:hypothetical protein
MSRLFLSNAHCTAWKQHLSVTILFWIKILFILTKTCYSLEHLNIFHKIRKLSKDAICLYHNRFPCWYLFFIYCFYICDSRSMLYVYWFHPKIYIERDQFVISRFEKKRFWMRKLRKMLLQCFFNCWSILKYFPASVVHLRALRPRTTRFSEILGFRTLPLVFP